MNGIPVEVLRNDWSVAHLVKLFNVCFHTGTVPDQWSRGIIIPIPKDAKNDLRDPLNYRGITVACATYKLYCSVLNNRLITKWVEQLFHNITGLIDAMVDIAEGTIRCVKCLYPDLYQKPQFVM